MKTETIDRQDSTQPLRRESVGSAIWELPTPALDEATIRRREGMLSQLQNLETRAGAEVESGGPTSS